MPGHGGRAKAVYSRHALKGFVLCRQEELYTERQRAEELAAALEECQDMVDALQQFSHDQGRDLAAAHTQLQARQPHIREAVWLQSAQQRAPAGRRMLRNC